MSKRTLAPVPAARAALALLALFLMAPATCFAEPVTVTIADVSGPPAHPPKPLRVQGPSHQLDLVVHTGRTVTLDKNIPRVLVNNPDVVKVTPLAADRVGVTALRAGVTQINLWDDDGDVHSVDVIVHNDHRELETILRTQFPTCTLRVHRLSEGVVISGSVDEPETLKDILEIAEAGFPKVIRNLTVAGTSPVKLHVALLEISLTKMKAKGLDWDDFPDTWHGETGDTHMFIVDDRDALVGFVNRLKRQEVAKVLASPTLMTVSRRPANFEAGTEVPIAAEGESIEYKFVGTRVEFMPHVFVDGRLRLETRLDVFDKNSKRDEKTGRLVHEHPPYPVCFGSWHPHDPVIDFRPGQTLVVRGRCQERVESKGRLVPMLEEVPFVGSDLARKMEKVEQFETLLIVTPEWQDADTEKPETTEDYGAVAVISDQGSLQTQ